MIEKSPILITGAERSGSSMIARILDICDVYSGKVNNMMENIAINEAMTQFLEADPNHQLMPDPDTFFLPVTWHGNVCKSLENEGLTKDKKWMCKGAKVAQMWPVWNYAFPNARWIIVRRRTGDIIQSCVKTGYMLTFKDPKNQKLVGAKSEEEGWLWWIHQYENRFRGMIDAGVNCKQIWPERMVRGDYEQIYEMLEWLGLKWNSKIFDTIDPMLTKSREAL